MLKLNVFIVLMSVALAGCGYQLRETPQTNENAGTANSNQRNANIVNKNNSTDSATEGNTTSGKDGANAGEKLVLTGTSEAAAYQCNGREVEIEESATANTFNLTGECKRLVVLGISNRISIEKVGEILVEGVSNKIVYGEGIGGKKPKITKKGVTNSVVQKGSEEEKKELESR